MHVLMLTSTLPRWPGDQQADFVGEQARAWLAARSNDRITILAPHSHGAPRIERHGRLTVRRYRYILPEAFQTLAYPAILPNLKKKPWLAAQVPLLIAAQYRAAVRIVRQSDVDCVYAHWVMPQGCVALALKRRFGLPYFLQNHSSDLAVFARLGRPGRRLARTLLREAAHFFCVNTDQLAFARALFAQSPGDDSSPVASVLPMGVAELPAKDRPESRYDIGTIGRLSRKKGYDLLISAAERLALDGIRPRIGIAGDGEELAALQQMVKAADIEFAGFLTGPEKDRFLASCARFAFPAKASGGDVEGLPVALLEALMRSQPVLASKDTNISLLPEWDAIQDDVVFVPDPDDVEALAAGLRRLLERSPGSAARAAAVLARYRWDRLIEEYLEPIERCMGSGTARDLS